MSPRMIRWRRLRIPYISRVSREMPAFHRLHEGFGIHNPPSSSVHQVCSFLHLEKPLVIEQPIGLRRQRAVDRNYIAPRNQIVQERVTNSENFFLYRTQPPKIIVKHRDVESLQSDCQPL